MGNLLENATWAAGVPYFEANAVLTGGPDCPDNIPIQALADRTAYLKDHVDKLENGSTASSKADKLTTARDITMTGDGSWKVSFDGSANVTGSLTLTTTGVAAGTYPKVTVDGKGRITAGSALAAADIPALDWSKITTGKPTTLAGYGITDALPASATAVAASKLSSSRTLTANGDASWNVAFDGSADVAAPLTLANTGVAAGSYPKVTVDAKGRVTAGSALAAADIPALDWSKITSGKPTTLAGYGITDAAPINSPVLTGTPTVPTAALGDSSLGIANTAFVQAALASVGINGSLGNSRTFAVITGSIALTATDVGKAFRIWQSNGTALTVTLPPVASVAAGATIRLFNDANLGGVPHTIKGNAADYIRYGCVSAINTMTLAQGESADFVCDGAVWWAFGSSAGATLASLGVFANSLATSGYQKLPGGLMLQWTTVSLNAAGNGSFLFPLAFAAPSVSVLACPCNTQPISVGVYGETAAGFSLAVSGAGAIRVWALGKSL